MYSTGTKKLNKTIFKRGTGGGGGGGKGNIVVYYFFKPAGTQ